MNFEVFLAVAGGILLVVLAVLAVLCTIFVVRAFAALRELVGKMQQLVNESESKVSRILENTEEISDAVLSTTRRINSATENVFSFPTMISQIGKEMVGRIFGSSEKRGSFSK